MSSSSPRDEKNWRFEHHHLHSRKPTLETPKITRIEKENHLNQPNLKTNVRFKMFSFQGVVNAVTIQQKMTQTNTTLGAPIFVPPVILLMEEILHHLGCINPCK